MKNIKIVYMGTPELSAKIFEGLISEGYNIVALIAQEDKPVGRKGLIKPVPTKEVALRYNIPVFQPRKIKDDYSFLKEINPDLIITCAYGQIVPQGLLDIPRLGCINVHGSLLPKYRGASPIQQALINGDLKTGVTIMEMISKMDAGDMFIKEVFDIDNKDNYTSLCDKIANAGISALLKVIPNIINGTAIKEKQDESLVTYCSKIKKEDEHLDLSLTNIEVVNMIRALSETPGSNVLLDGQVFKIYEAEISSLNEGEIGQIIRADKTGLIVKTGKGSIKLLQVQKQGKKKMDYKSFINGEKDLLGKILK